MRHGVVIIFSFRFMQRSLKLAIIFICIDHELQSAAFAAWSLLGHGGSAQIVGQLDSALFDRDFLRQRLEQTGFAGTVSTDDTRALSNPQVDAGILKKQLVAAHQRDIVEGYHGMFLLLKSPPAADSGAILSILILKLLGEKLLFRPNHPAIEHQGSQWNQRQRPQGLEDEASRGV